MGTAPNVDACFYDDNPGPKGDKRTMFCPGVQYDKEFNFGRNAAPNFWDDSAIKG
jgi:hypothetical protein